jgi:hypothetical protein
VSDSADEPTIDDGTAPMAGGDAAANIALEASGERVAIRWVARRTGTIHKLYLRVKVEGSTNCPYGGRTGYAAGTTGLLDASTYAVAADGLPDSETLLAHSVVQPCGREDGESLDLDLDFEVYEGQELVTVIRNVDDDSSRNYFSLNFLYAASGLVGANARNERDPEAPDAFYGLDPREIVGYSEDGGETWELPGGPYGPKGGKAFLPTYIQEYADGYRTGQPYYYARELAGRVTMVYAATDVPSTITALGAYTLGPGTAAVELRVDGVERASILLTGSGMLRRRIDPVTVSRGQTVTVTTRAGSQGLALGALYADRAWDDLMGLGPGFSYYLESDPVLAVPVYPLATP